jgi:hypothetical protein
MKAFLNALWVYDLSVGSDDTDLCGFSSSAGEQITALYHTNWNLISDNLLKATPKRWLDLFPCQISFIGHHSLFGKRGLIRGRLCHGTQEWGLSSG